MYKHFIWLTLTLVFIGCSDIRPNVTPSHTPIQTPLALTPTEVTIEVVPSVTETPITPQPDVLLLIEYEDKDAIAPCLSADRNLGLHELWLTKYPYDSAEKILTTSNSVNEMLWLSDFSKIIYSEIDVTHPETTISDDGYGETRIYDEDLWIINIDGTDRRKIFGGYTLKTYSDTGRCSPEWFALWDIRGASPDGKWLGLLDPSWSILDIETGEHIVFSDRSEYKDNPKGLLDSVGISEYICQTCCYSSIQEREKYEAKPCPEARSITLWQGTPYEALQLPSIHLDQFEIPEQHRISAYFLAPEHHHALYVDGMR